MKDSPVDTGKIHGPKSEAEAKHDEAEHEPNEPGDPVENQYDPEKHHLLREVIFPQITNRKEQPQPHAVPSPQDYLHYTHGQLQAGLMFAWDPTNLVPTPVTVGMLGGASAPGLLALLDSQSLTNANLVAVNGVITSQYDEYLIRLLAVAPGSQSDFFMQLSADNGATYISATSYYGTLMSSPPLTSNPPAVIAPSGMAYGAQPQFTLAQAISPAASSASGICGEINIYNPLQSLNVKEIKYSFACSSGGGLMTIVGGGAIVGTVIYNAFKLFFNNPFSGLVRTFGITK